MKTHVDCLLKWPVNAQPFKPCRVGMLFTLSLTGFFVLAPAFAALAGYSYITNFAKTANDQANLQQCFPVGLFVTGNSFATPFDIVSDASGKNFCEVGSSVSPLVISNVGLQGVTTVYTLMNAYSPGSGALASVEFVGSVGASQLFTLTGGVNIRDFYNGKFANAINGTTTQNAYQIYDVVGAGGTGNSSTGDIGTYRLDEQEFVLSSAFQNQTLQTITISNLNGASTPLLIGVTALIGETAKQAAPGILFSETFTNLTYKPAWTLETPNPDSSYTLNGTDLTLVASYQNGGSDLTSGTKYAAPRLLQPVNPSLDWIIETQMDLPPSTNNQAAGILLADTDGAFASSADFSPIAEMAYTSAGALVIQSVGSQTAFTNQWAFLRVQKLGANYTGWHSGDGVNWTLGGAESMSQPWSFVGLFVASDGPAASTGAVFDYFEATILPPSLSIQPTNNSVLISWPATASVYTLEQNSAPNGAGWALNTNTVSIANGACQVTVTPASNAMFFRLVYP